MMRRHAAMSDRVLILLCAVLVVTSLLPASWADTVARYPHNLVTALTTPLTVQLRSLSLALRPPRQQTLLSEDQAWRDQFIAQKQIVIRLEEEVAALRDQIRVFEQIASVLEDASAVRLLSARVSRSAVTPSQRVLGLDRGQRMGVEAGQAVVHGRNLVGQVVRSGVATCEVELLTVPGLLLRVRIEPADARAPASAADWVQVSDDGQHFFRVVPAQTTIRVGDLAHLADDRWPSVAQGFLIGQVTQVVDDPTNPLQFKRVTIEPLIELARLREVTILIPQRTRESTTR